MLLCQNNQAKILYYFVQKLLKIDNLNINQRDKRGNNALTLLCQYYSKSDCKKNLIDIVTQLLRKGIDVHCATSDSKTNALMFCCIQYKHDNLLEIVQLFIDYQIDVNAVNVSGKSALYLLCEYYHKPNLIEIIRLFIQNGVNLKATTKDEWNVLHCVCRLCRYFSGDRLLEIIKLFLENGISVNSLTNGKWSALHFLCRYYSGDNLIEFVRIFIQNDAELEGKTAKGDSVLSLLHQHYKGQNLQEIQNLLTNKKANNVSTIESTRLFKIKIKSNNQSIEEFPSISLSAASSSVFLRFVVIILRL